MLNNPLREDRCITFVSFSVKKVRVVGSAPSRNRGRLNQEGHERHEE